MMMEWSTTIQGIELLDRSRELRFRDEQAATILRVLDIGSAKTIAEVGCGPGALARALGRWLGSDARIVGIDLDPKFVGYAQRKASEDRLNHLSFIQGDGLSLPLRDDSVDACLSYTVIEHLPNEQFLSEQARACRRGGRVIAMVTLPDKSLASMPEGWPPPSAEELKLWEVVREAFEATENIRGVGGHWPDPAGLPRLFEKLGLAGVRVDALALPVVADDARLTADQRTRIIDADLRIALERIEMAARLIGPARRPETDELGELVTARFAARLDAAERGERIWDYSVSFVLVVSGQR